MQVWPHGLFVADLGLALLWALSADWRRVPLMRDLGTGARSPARPEPLKDVSSVSRSRVDLHTLVADSRG
jgi:hypothetical protein